MEKTSTLGSNGEPKMRDFLPKLKKYLGVYVMHSTYYGTCEFLMGYETATDEHVLRDFQRWLVSRGRGRPELYWPLLALCEIYDDEDLPNIRNLSVEQNSQANELLFRLFDEFFELRSASLCRTARGQCNEW
jgi:hypothetical protein